MPYEILKQIVQRHLLTIREVAKKAAQGEIVGDLVRAQVRKCLIEMHAAGAEPEHIRDIFDNLEDGLDKKCAAVEPKFWQLLMTMKLHVEFLLFIEENDYSNGPSIRCPGPVSDIH
ncbi:hypothetical protein [Herbaspirillum huttiense]|jgi:hypothetical protein|uniref:Uncharacterized protein n=2 Tax=Herbaspirillum huttiense TaxID=863372 RepID=A0AAJ2HG58_9BURK|nr:hypothetical protein [Herbaspirillum huttiense]MDR9839395.1 hypothetical protein [Herbaspirillum huttiense]